MMRPPQRPLTPLESILIALLCLAALALLLCR